MISKNKTLWSYGSVRDESKSSSSARVRGSFHEGSFADSVDAQQIIPHDVYLLPALVVSVLV